MESAISESVYFLTELSGTNNSVVIINIACRVSSSISSSNNLPPVVIAYRRVTGMARLFLATWASEGIVLVERCSAMRRRDVRDEQAIDGRLDG